MGQSAEDAGAGYIFLLLRAPLADKASMWMMNAKQRMQRPVAGIVEEGIQDYECVQLLLNITGV